MRRFGRGSHLRSHALAAGLERTVSKASHYYHIGTKIDLLAVAPKTVGFWVDQASLLWSDSSAHWNHSKGPLFLGSHQAASLFWQVGGVVGHSGIATCWSSWFRVDSGHRRGWRGSGERTKTVVQLFHEGPGTMIHRCFECPALQTERDMQVSQEVRQAARSLGPQYREQFPHGIFPRPDAILPTGSPEPASPVLWHNRPPDGMLEWHIFTDGSSSGSGALRRAGSAVVASRRCGESQDSCSRGSPERCAAGTDLARGRGLRCCRSHHHGPAHAAHRLRRHHRFRQ